VARSLQLPRQAKKLQARSSKSSEQAILQKMALKTIARMPFVL
jgi:hypothetical protein